ncbi:hypothetical protein BKA70DRAFT_1578879 [Coprinopsis sp. MPI-PUGE-AT-0042]|nr:hypothetical protein BKA70DRAFT_1578879 [Coprinopsis sp. MPI-PUGE-AT-0042]
MHMIESSPMANLSTVDVSTQGSVSVQDNDLALAAVLVCTSLYGFQIYVAVQALISVPQIWATQAPEFKAVCLHHPYAPALGWRDDYYGLEVIVQDGKLSAVAVGCRAALGLAGNAFMVWRAITIWDDRRCLQWFLRLVYTFYFGVCVVAVFLHISSLEDFIVLMGDLRYYWFLPKDRLSYVIHVKAMYQTWWMVELGGSVGVSALATVLISGRLLLERRRSGHLRKMYHRYSARVRSSSYLDRAERRGIQGQSRSSKIPWVRRLSAKLTYIDYMLHSIWIAGLVWRAAILWSHNRLMKWVPVVLYIIYFGAAIASTVFKVYAFRDVDLAAAKFVEWFAEADRPAEYQEGYDHFQALRLAQFAYQSWRITDFAMSVGSGIFKSALPYRRLIALLLESALPFTLVGVAGAISTAFIDPFGQKQNKATTIFPLMIVLWTNPLALGPQLIIFRILSRKTWTSNPTTSPSRVISQPILFAQATSRRSHDALSTHSSDMDEEEVMARVGSGKMLACPMDHPVRRRSENRMSV